MRLPRPIAALLVLLLLAPAARPGAAGAQTMAAGGVEVTDTDGGSTTVLARVSRDASLVAAPGGTSLVLLEGATGQVIAARDADVRRPVASAIKLVTALVVVDALAPGHLITVGEEVRGIEGSSYGLRVGEVRTVEDLLAGLLLRSGNDAAVALAHAVSGEEATFVLHMRDVLAGLDIDAAPASASGLSADDALSAAELAIVARTALSEPRIRDIVGRRELEVDGVGRVENRNLFVGQFTGATGLKTGFTSAAGYTLAASARRDGRELVAIVLGAPDDGSRRTSAAQLLEYGFSTTRVAAVDRSVTLRTARGPVRFATEGVVVTLALDEELTARWPATLRPDDVISAVDINIDGRSAGTAALVRRDARAATAAPERASIGAALVDGAYAVMRPFGLTGGLR